MERERIMITGFLKKHRAAIIITGSYILLMLCLYLLIPGPNPIRRETTTLEECMELLQDPGMSRKLMEASAILLDKSEGEDRFDDYLYENVFPNNGSITNLETLKNDRFFTQEEQAAMTEAFSALKGLDGIKYGGWKIKYLEFQLHTMNDGKLAWLTLFFCPHKGGTPDIREEFSGSLLEYEFREVDDNWYTAVLIPSQKTEGK